MGLRPVSVPLCLASLSEVIYVAASVRASLFAAEYYAVMWMYSVVYPFICPLVDGLFAAFGYYI